MSKSKAEEALAWHLTVSNIPYTRELKFHPTRKWRLDFAIEHLKIGIEIDGITRYGKNRDGSMKLGRHQTAKGVENDCEKYSEAMLLGWTVYRCTQSMVTSGKAIDTILKLVEMRRSKNDEL